MLTVALFGAAVVPSAADTEASTYTPTIEWGACPKNDTGIERSKTTKCGQLEVPVDWSDPDGEKIILDVAVEPAKDKERRKGILMWGPGGPGLQGEPVIGRYDLFSPDVEAVYDQVGYDSRGLGRNEIRCEKPSIKAPYLPGTREEFDQRIAYNKAVAKSCEEKSGELAENLDADSDARDMDAVRAALGEDKLNYLGASYGTVRGQAYRELFPERVGRWVHDSSVGDMSNMRDFDWDMTEAVEVAFRNFLAWWQEQASDKAVEDVEKIYEQAYQRAKDKGGRYVEDLLSVVAVQSAQPSTWQALATELTERASGKNPGEPNPLIEYDPQAQAIFCNDWRGEDPTYEEYQRMRAEFAEKAPLVRLAEHAFGTNANPLACAGWPKPDGDTSTAVGARPGDETRTGDGGLAIGIRHDVRTPYVWSKQLAAENGDSLLTVEGYGHSAYYAQWEGKPKSCVTKAVDGYLLTGEHEPSTCHEPLKP